MTAKVTAFEALAGRTGRASCRAGLTRRLVDADEGALLLDLPAMTTSVSARDPRVIAASIAALVATAPAPTASRLVFGHAVPFTPRWSSRLPGSLASRRRSPSPPA